MSSPADRATLFKSGLIERIARVELRVTHLDRALSFYADVAGLELIDRDGARAILGVRGAAPFLELRSDGVTAPADPSATGLFHTAIRFPTRAALGDALARLLAAEYPVAAGDHLVSEALYIDDPDGNGVELYWDRPVEQWPGPTEDMLVPMTTLAVDLHDLLGAGMQQAAIDKPAPAGTGVGHVHLQVADIAATNRFYSETLGLDLTARLGGSAGFYSSNGYHHHIGANTWRSRGSKPAQSDHAGLDRIVFAVSRSDEWGSLLERLAPEGIAEGPGEAVVATDPDGVELHLEPVDQALKLP